MLKFRAFSNKLKRYVDIQEFSVTDGEIDGIVDTTGASRDLLDVTLEQLTEVEDAQGHDIYVGDMLYDIDDDSLIGEVVYDDMEGRYWVGDSTLFEGAGTGQVIETVHDTTTEGLKARKKPIEINVWRIKLHDPHKPSWVESALANGVIDWGDDPIPYYLNVHGLEGVLSAKPDDYLVKGVHGELYSIDCVIFEETYDIVK